MRPKPQWPNKHDAWRAEVVRGPFKNPHEKLMSALRVKLSPDFFNTLPILGKSKRVRLAEINGVRVVIKDTEAGETQGYLYNNLRRSFLQHQLAVRNGKIKPVHYVLRSPKVFGRIGPYLVMRFVDEYLPVRGGADADSTSAAYRELIINFGKIKEIGFYSPQLTDMMFEKGSINKGRWTIFLPYDHL